MPSTASFTRRFPKRHRKLAEEEGPRAVLMPSPPPLLICSVPSALFQDAEATLLTRDEIGESYRDRVGRQSGPRRE